MEFSILPPPGAELVAESWSVLMEVGIVSGALALVVLTVPLFRHAILPAAFGGVLRVLLAIHGANAALAAVILLSITWQALSGRLDPELWEVFPRFVLEIVVPNVLGLVVWRRLFHQRRQEVLLRVVP